MPKVPPPKHFEVDSQPYGHTVFVRLRGEFDLAAEPHFDHAVATIEESARQIVVDLTELSFIDSTGLRALLRMWERSRTDGHDLAFVPGNDQVRHAMELTGINGVLPIVTEPPVAPVPSYPD
jgi:anti-anti-sigma factor